MSGIPLTAINGGMNRLRVKGAARRDTLYQLTNGYVTAGSTVKARPGTIRNVNLAATTGAGTTKGLVAYGGSRHIFSDHVVPVPAGYTLHVLSHPAVQATYTPPFPPDNGGTPFVSTVQSLLHFEDGNGSTTFTDAGTAAPVWTSNGGAACSTTQAKFGTGALLCNSTTKYISTPVASGGALDLIVNQQDWTVEFWFWATTLTGGPYVLIDFSCGLTTLFRIYVAGTQLTAQTLGGGSGWNGAGQNAAAPSLGAGQWNHVAICRDNNLCRLYANGTFVGGASGVGGSFASIGTAIPGSSTFKIGGSSSNFGTAQTMYIDDIRITTGACLYGANFTPPSAALTSVPAFPYSIASLLHFDDGANSTAFVDQVSTVWTAQGAAKEVSAPAEFGVGSGAFLVNADYIQTSVTAGDIHDMSIAQADFTFEAFIYPLDVTSGSTHMWMDTAHKTNATTHDVMFTLSSVAHNLTLNNWMTGGSGVTAVNALPTAGVWYHVAVVHYGLEFRLFVNGVQVATTNSGFGAGAALAISTGAKWNLGTDGGTNSADGYIDEFRAIQGLAVYRANFTAPLAPYTAPGFATIALKEVHFAAPFMGFLYVVAEFVQDGGSGLGTVFHYWLQTSGKWLASTMYQVGQIISPTVANGMSFRAERVTTPSPKWAASTLKAVSDKVEPSTPNGFLYTASAVDGANPITGTTEPTWPTVAGAVVYEESEKTGTGEVAGPAPQPSATTPSPGTGGKYTNPYRGLLGT